MSTVKANSILPFTQSSDIVSFRHQWNSGSFSTNQTIVTPAIHGNNTLFIELTDSANNLNTYTYILFVDYQAPSIGTSVTNNGNFLRTESLIFNFSEPIKSFDSFYIYNGQRQAITTQSFSISNFDYGNHTINVTISAVDNFDNNRTLTYYFNVIDPALQYSINIEDGDLITETGFRIKVNTSKGVDSIYSTWHYRDGTYVTNNIGGAGTFIGEDYLINGLDSDGEYSLAISILTFDNYWVNVSYDLTVDVTAPTILLYVDQVDITNVSLIRTINSYSSETLMNLAELEPLKLELYDFSSYTITYNITFTNGTSFTDTFTTSKQFDLEFLTPNLNENVTILVTLIDEYGHITERQWLLVVYDRPTFTSGFEFASLLTIVITLALLRRKYA